MFQNIMLKNKKIYNYDKQTMYKQKFKRFKNYQLGDFIKDF